MAFDIHLANRVIISVKSATYRAGRGFTTLAIILDEIAFFRSEESANPAEEIVDSLLPGLKESGQLIGLSTPYSRAGFFFEVFEENYKKESPILIWKAATKIMHPDFKQSIITRLLKRRGKDKTLAMRSEFEAEWRADIESFVTLEEYQAAVLEGIPQVPPMSANRYRAFVDMSGGKRDSSCLGISHHEDGLAALDLVFEVRAPHNPEDAVKNICEILERYRVREVTGDRFSGNWAQSSYRKKGIVYNESKLDKNAIYEEFQALLAMGRLMLIDNERLRRQCIGLERRLRSGGRDQIDHAPGAFDDLVNVAAGSCQLIFQTEIATQLTSSEIRARLPHQKAQTTYRGRNKLRIAMKEMDEIMMASGCNRIVKKRPFL